MNAQYRRPAKRLYRIGVSLLLTAHAAHSLASMPQTAFTDTSALANYAGIEPLLAGLAARPELQASADGDDLPAVTTEALCFPEISLPDAIRSSAMARRESSDQDQPAINEAAATPGNPTALTRETTNSDSIPDPIITATAGPETDSGIEPTTALVELPADVPLAVAVNPLGPDMVALGPESLDMIRGGFEIAGTQLKFSFGIERTVFINGDLASTTLLNLGNLRWTGGQGTTPQAVTQAANSIAGTAGTTGITGTAGTAGSAISTGGAAVIQNGAGNSAPIPIAADFAGTVIQNTLNNQNLQTVTTINAEVNSAQVLRSMTVHTAIQNGIVNSLRR